MLTITEAAYSRLADLIEKHESSGVVVLRIVAAEKELTLKGDKLRAGDKTFEYRGKPVLAVDQKVYLHLGEKTLDVERTGGKERLTLR